MAINSSDYVLEAVENILLLDIVTDELIAILKNVKDTTWSNTNAVNYASTRGVKIVSIKSEKESSVETSNATITDGLLALQTGTNMELVTDSTEIFYTDTFAITSNAGVTTFTAIGTTDAEIGFLYVLDQFGTETARLTQVSGVPTTGEFAYDSGTKAITTFAGDVTDGATVMAIYNATVSISKRFVNDAYAFPNNVKMVLNGLFKEACGQGLSYAGQLIMPNAEVGTDMTYDIPETGDPAVQNAMFTSLKPCLSDNLWILNVYNSSDIS